MRRVGGVNEMDGVCIVCYVGQGGLGSAWDGIIQASWTETEWIERKNVLMGSGANGTGRRRGRWVGVRME